MSKLYPLTALIGFFVVLLLRRPFFTWLGLANPLLKRLMARAKKREAFIPGSLAKTTPEAVEVEDDFDTIVAFTG
jgi:hypothetical protein